MICTKCGGPDASTFTTFSATDGWSHRTTMVHADPAVCHAHLPDSEYIYRIYRKERAKARRTLRTHVTRTRKQLGLVAP